MNIIAVRKDERSKKISIIVETIKKAFDAGLDIDKENLVGMCCSRFMTARRTSLEYVQVALFSFNTAEIIQDGRTLIINKSSKSSDGGISEAYHHVPSEKDSTSFLPHPDNLNAPS